MKRISWKHVMNLKFMLKSFGKNGESKFPFFLQITNALMIFWKFFREIDYHELELIRQGVVESQWHDKNTFCLHVKTFFYEVVEFRSTILKQKFREINFFTWSTYSFHSLEKY